MRRKSPLSLRSVGRVLGTVGLASAAAWVAHRAWRDSHEGSRTHSRPTIRPVVLRPVVHSPLRDGHLGAREKGFDWAGTGRA